MCVKRTVSDNCAKIIPEANDRNNFQCLVSSMDFFLWGSDAKKWLLGQEHPYDLRIR